MYGAIGAPSRTIYLIISIEDVQPTVRVSAFYQDYSHIPSKVRRDGSFAKKWVSVLSGWVFIELLLGSVTKNDLAMMDGWTDWFTMVAGG